MEGRGGIGKGREGREEGLLIRVWREGRGPTSKGNGKEGREERWGGEGGEGNSPGLLWV